MGPKWNSTSSIASLGTSASNVRRIALTWLAVVSVSSSRMNLGLRSVTVTSTSDPATPPASLRLRPVVRDRGHVLDAADLDAGPREGTDGGLGPGAGRPRPVPAGSADPDADGAGPLLLP